MQPIGLALETVSINSHDWELWYCQKWDMLVFTFVAPKSTNLWTMSLKHFSTMQNKSTSSWPLSSVCWVRPLEKLQCSQRLSSCDGSSIL